MPAENTSASASAGVSVVIDASVAIPWIIQEQSSSTIDALFQDGYRGLVALWVPSLWLTECGSVLNEMVKKKRLTLKQAQEAFTTLRYCRLQIDGVHSAAVQSRILQLAQDGRLSFYDATYIELAQRKSYMLATLDSAMRRAAQAVGVHCLDIELNTP
jgi:predicted nucleic acid-binding protein